MDIQEELEIEETYLAEERTTLIYMITGISYAALGFILIKISYDFGLTLILGKTNLTSWIGGLLIVGGFLVSLMQIPKLVEEEKSRKKFEKDYLDKDLKKEFKKK